MFTGCRIASHPPGTHFAFPLVGIPPEMKNLENDKTVIIGSSNQIAPGLMQINTLFVTAVTEAEIRAGIAYLPAGERQRGLVAAADRAFGEMFSARVLPFDSYAARAYASITAARRASGRPISHHDCQIAAIARALGASVATRYVDGFEGCGIEVINPWAGQQARS